MEGFEHFVKVALETEGLIVTGNLKFPVSRPTKDGGRQTHGYEIDLVGARHDLLVLASVKSFFGSLGVNRQGFKGIADEKKKCHFGRYIIFNEQDIRDGVLAEASKQFGYPLDQIEMRLYTGKIRSEKDKEAITLHLGGIRAGRGSVRMIGLNETVETLFKEVMSKKTYINDPVVVALKALKHAGYLSEPKSVAKVVADYLREE